MRTRMRQLTRHGQGLRAKPAHGVRACRGFPAGPGGGAGAGAGLSGLSGKSHSLSVPRFPDLENGEIRVPTSQGY